MEKRRQGEAEKSCTDNCEQLEWHAVSEGIKGWGVF